jgi:hypothetical protein
MAVFIPAAADSTWSLTRVCVKLASAMQSIKVFCASELWKADCWAARSSQIVRFRRSAAGQYRAKQLQWREFNEPVTRQEPPVCNIPDGVRIATAAPVYGGPHGTVSRLATQGACRRAGHGRRRARYSQGSGASQGRTSTDGPLPDPGSARSLPPLAARATRCRDGPPSGGAGVGSGRACPERL